MRLYSNEIVFRGHPDKVSDQIGDALLDAYLAQDKNTRAGIEVLGGKGKIFITGEVTSNASVNVDAVVQRVLKEVGYTHEKYEVVNNIGMQSPDIAQGVDVGGAGDQGMMFGYACDETDKLLPKAMVILQELSKEYDRLRSEKPETFFADGKAQITGYYDEVFRLQKIKTFTISYQNAEVDRESSDAELKGIALDICKKYDIEVEEFLINPTGKFLVGGYVGDAGCTNRKIVVDTYQSFAPIGGGGLSGKDSTKVDRSGHYKARQLAVRMLNKKDLKWCQVQISYAIGVAEPLAIYIDSNIGHIEAPSEWFSECTPANIISDFNLRDSSKIKYEDTAKFGHFGNDFAWEV